MGICSRYIMPRFSKEHRLLFKKDFVRVQRYGIRGGTEQISVLFVPGDKRRIGLIVSKKVGTSVVRNRVKRVMREHFRSNKDLYPCGDLVVVVKDKMKAISNSIIRKNLELALNRLLARLKR